MKIWVILLIVAIASLGAADLSRNVNTIGLFATCSQKTCTELELLTDIVRGNDGVCGGSRDLALGSVAVVLCHGLRRKISVRDQEPGYARKKSC